MMIDIDTLLAWGAAYKKVAPEEIVFNEGSESHFYYQLVGGSVRWVTINDDGREFLQHMVEPGECFGELSLFDGGLYAASAIANNESVVIRLHRDIFLQLLKEHPGLHFSFSRIMAERMRFKFMLLNELAYNTPEHRISTLLSYFKEKGKFICGDCAQVQLTRQQIADMTGLRVETVIRTMKSLENKGAVVIDRGKVFC
jgi:CRP-like cAMP-binding protein